MKSKITLIIMIVIIIFFAACSFFLGYNYLKRGDEIQNLNAKIESLTQELDTPKTEDTTTNEPSQNDEDVVEKLERITVDASKVDNSARPYIKSIEENGAFYTIGSFNYRTGPVQKSTISADITKYQIRYNNKDYVVSTTANIVDIKAQRGAFIILLSDGTIKYAKMPLEENLQFKDYTNIKDAVALVNFYSTDTEGGKAVSGVGVITSDGVTHILPYEMP